VLAPPARHRQHAAHELLELQRGRDVRLVVGELHLRPLARELEAALAIPVALFDERLSTAAAEQMLRDLGVKPEKRKQQIDQVAASIILQDYLDHTRNP
ncbi:MAG: Holliday junction resolvase RuvX, partial [Oscillochloris sp.]|nr:Holliday junction resolvase RuvX [Oscillochloris sp.]